MSLTETMQSLRDCEENGVRCLRIEDGGIWACRTNDGLVAVSARRGETQVIVSLTPQECEHLGHVLLRHSGREGDGHE